MNIHMTPLLRKGSCIAGAFILGLGLGAPITARAGEPQTVAPSAVDLTLGNFFSRGWTEDFACRSRGEGTPDMSLLRVQTNFVARVFRTDFTIQQGRQDNAVRFSDGLTETVEYAFNQRLMAGVIGNYRWTDSRTGEDLSGAAVGGCVRLQLVNTAASTFASTFRFMAPNHEFGERATTLSLALEGWQDLAPLGLSRTGLYYHVQEETLSRQMPPGARRNDLTYDISVAKTWTAPNAFCANASTFLEAYGRTDLDGDNAGRTLVTLTPGVRATFAKRHVVMAGVDFPVTERRPFDRIVRLTYILCF